MSGYPKKTDIPTKSRKKFCDFFSENIYNRLNHCITEGNFIADFKKAEVCPPYKNDVIADKSNHMTEPYRPISIFSYVSKIYERCLYSDYYYMTTLINISLVKASVLSMPF